MYARVWEYEVRASDVEAFLAAYGASGAWVKLFARSEDYGGTRLFRDVGQTGRYLTVDRWTDHASWEEFLDRWGSDYRELDLQLSGLADGGEMIAGGLDEGF